MTMSSSILLSIVCPCYNEESTIPLFFEALEPVLEGITRHYEIICIDDGSTDGTLARLLAAAERNPRIRIIELSRNFGKEAALTCGLDHARGDAIIPMTPICKTRRNHQGSRRKMARRVRGRPCPA